MPFTTIQYRGRLCCAGIFCLLAATAGAQDAPVLIADDDTVVEEELRRYTVEMIVFSYTDNAASGSELFTPEPIVIPEVPLNSTDSTDPLDSVLTTEPVLGIEDSAQPQAVSTDESVEDAVPAFGDFLGDVEFEDEELVELIANDRVDLKILMPDELTMTQTHEKLVLLDAYQPVMWGGWTQGTLTEEETPFVRLRRLGNIPLAFEGNLKLYLSRFLHLVVDIAMDEESPAPIDATLSAAESQSGRRVAVDFGYPIYASERTPIIRFKILEDRIVKSEDIRYFDHPKFGVIAKVTRYVAPEEEAASEEGEAEVEELEEEPGQPRT